MVLGTLVGKDDTWVLWAIIIVWATISIFLEQRYQWASTISGAIIALVGAMLLSNFKVIPTSAPVYDTVWDYIVPLSIPLLLFSSNILKIWKESRRLLFIFLIASIGTMIGTTVAFIILNSFSALFIKNRGDDDWKLHWWGCEFCGIKFQIKNAWRNGFIHSCCR